MKKGLSILWLLISLAGLSQTPAPKELVPVTVKGQRPLVTSRIDGFMYDARSSKPIAGETAIDVLRRLPGVIVDRDGVPTMRGSSQIKVFIDGRPSTIVAMSVAEALRQLPSENIARIEIITHPSAKYDAEGVDGVINIYTKRRIDDGVSGNLNLTGGGPFNQITGSVALRRHKWFINTDGGYYHSSNERVSLLRRKENSLDLEQQEINRDVSDNYFGGLNTALVADSLTTMSIGYRYSSMNNMRRVGVEGNIETHQDHFERLTHNPSVRYIHTLNWVLTKKSKDKTAQLDLMANWFYQGHTNDYSQVSSRATAADEWVYSHGTTGNRELSLQADATKSYRRSIFEAGVKTAYRRFDNQLWLAGANTRYDRFWFNWTIVAGYVNYMLTLKSWQLKMGARYEQTYWPMHFRDTSLTLPLYRNILPNLIVSAALSEAHRLSVGFARKLMRPYINYLNPVVNYIDSLNLEYGNPHLQPSLSNNYDLGYTYHEGSTLFTLTLFFNQTNNSIEPVRILRPDGIVATTYGNVARYRVLGSTAAFSCQLDKFSFSLNSTLRQLRFPARRGVVLNNAINISYKPGKGFSAGGLVNLNTEDITLQGHRTAWQRYTLVLNKDWLSGRLSIGGRVDGVFAHYQYITETTDDGPFYQTLRTRFIHRWLRVSIAYKFGKKEIHLPNVKQQVTGAY